jgi:OOP family OmpA-OmpF porin
MKKIVLIASLLHAIILFGQTNESSTDTLSENYNKWTIELTAGQLKGVTPFSEGYFSSESSSFFGQLDVNSFSLGARYMFSANFGMKLGLNIDKLKNLTDQSFPFKIEQKGISLQGVINANRLLNIEKYLGRLAILVHGGFKVDEFTTKTINSINYNKKEFNGGIVYGITPQFRITKKIALFADVTVQNNYRQHLNWDGGNSNYSINNLNGQSITTSIGLTLSLGKNEMHGDWAKIKSEKIKKIESVNSRIKNIESLLNDVDKDGVADYLDQENNSAAGVAVDSRGKMVDLDRDGIPDELERYLNATQKEQLEKNNLVIINNLINDGYVSTNFEVNKSAPTNVSSEGIGFIRTFLRNNPAVKIQIIGHADELKASDKNRKLSNARATAIKETLIQSGINADRLLIVNSEKDILENENTISKVTFKILE